MVTWTPPSEMEWTHVEIGRDEDDNLYLRLMNETDVMGGMNPTNLECIDQALKTLFGE